MLFLLSVGFSPPLTLGRCPNTVVCVHPFVHPFCHYVRLHFFPDPFFVSRMKIFEGEICQWQLKEDSWRAALEWNHTNIIKKPGGNLPDPPAPGLWANRKFLQGKDDFQGPCVLVSGAHPLPVKRRYSYSYLILLNIWQCNLSVCCAIGGEGICFKTEPTLH